MLAWRCDSHHAGNKHRVKAFKLAVPLHSTDPGVIVCLFAVKKIKQCRLFLEHLGILCSDPTPLYEDNLAVISLVK